MGPDDELATLIAERLIDAKLIGAERLAEASAKIAAGKATADDWRFWVEFGPSGPSSAEVAKGAGNAPD